MEFGLGVFICIFNKDFSKILLIKRSNEKNWGNVGGRVELGEKAADACIREAKEEINVDLKDLKFISFKETFFPKVHAIHFVYAAVLDENEPITLNSESEDYGWFGLEDLPDKTLDSKAYLKEVAVAAREEFSTN